MPQAAKISSLCKITEELQVKVRFDKAFPATCTVHKSPGVEVQQDDCQPQRGLQGEDRPHILVVGVVPSVGIHDGAVRHEADNAAV